MELYLNIIMLIFFVGCSQGQPSDDYPHTKYSSDIIKIAQHKSLIYKAGKTISERILAPDQFKRSDVHSNSFAEYLRNLNLKPHDSAVKYYNGKVKPNNNVYDAVIDLNIGNKNLHQCADAIMRLKAEFHWQNEEYDKIHFNFTNGFNVEYSEWMKGRRMIVKGNKTFWNSANKSSNTYEDFWDYMELIFTYAGTSSLSKELEQVEIEKMEIGDVLIQGGFPGHAVIILDMAVSDLNDEKLFLLGQSYMPAQEIQVLKNNNDKKISPWYKLNSNEPIITPEWTFNSTDLMRFKE